MKTLEALNKAEHLLAGLECPEGWIKNETDQLRLEVRGLIKLCEISGEENLQLDTFSIRARIDDLVLQLGQINNEMPHVPFAALDLSHEDRSE